MKLFLPMINSETILTKIDAAAGASLSSYHHLLYLSKFAELFVPSKVEKEIAPNIYGITLPRSSMVDLRDWFFKQNFDGIFMTSSREFDLFRWVAEIPIVMRLPSVRGYHGRMLDGILRCYSLMREYDCICPKSKWGKEFLSKYISNPSALYPIPNGVDSELFAPIEKSKAKAEVSQILKDERISQRPVVGFVSRFQPEKGSMIFLEIAGMNPDLLFLAVGPVVGDYRRFVGENVIFAGYQQHDKLPLFYNAFDVLCFPSVAGFELCSSVVLEGMACGLPIVATDFDGVTEFVKAVGVLAPAIEYETEICGISASVDPYEFSQRIRNLLSDETEREKLGQLARERALQLSWDFVAKEIINLFGRLNEKKNHYRPLPISVNFMRKYDIVNGVSAQAIVYNCKGFSVGPLRYHLHAGYDLPAIEGIALLLLQNLPLNQVEAALLGLLKDEAQLRAVLQKVLAFANILPDPPNEGDILSLQKERNQTEEL